VDTTARQRAVASDLWASNAEAIYGSVRVENRTKLCFKSRSFTWIGSVQGAVATWSTHRCQNR